MRAVASRIFSLPLYNQYGVAGLAPPTVTSPFVGAKNRGPDLATSAPLKSRDQDSRRGNRRPINDAVRTARRHITAQRL